MDTCSWAGRAPIKVLYVIPGICGALNACFLLTPLFDKQVQISNFAEGVLSAGFLTVAFFCLGVGIMKTRAEVRATTRIPKRSRPEVERTPLGAQSFGAEPADW